jgi:hypothetical protein
MWSEFKASLSPPCRLCEVFTACISLWVGALPRAVLCVFTVVSNIQLTRETLCCIIYSSACSKTSYSNRIIDPIPEEQEMDVVGHSEQATNRQGKIGLF